MRDLGVDYSQLRATLDGEPVELALHAPNVPAHSLPLQRVWGPDSTVGSTIFEMWMGL